MTIAELRLETFSPHIGSPFRIVFSDATLTLTLEQVKALNINMERQGFSLEFRGAPGAPVLMQNTYPLEHDVLGQLEIFIVPIGDGENGAQYQAIFT
jgi:hypothetical protein